jgi:amidase
VDQAVALLTAAGHTVVRRDPPVSTGAAAGALARWMAGAEDDAASLGIDRDAPAAAQPHPRRDRPPGPADRPGAAAHRGTVP